MPLHFIYPIYTGILALIAVTIVPRKEIHRLAIYGIFFGAVFDILIIILTQAAGIGGYINFGPFGFLGIPFFPPIAWTIFFIMYLYILPKHKICAYIFSVVAAGYSTFFSNILKNLGIFKWNYSILLLPFILYASWFLIVTWAYSKFANSINEEKPINYRVLKLNTAKNKTVPNIVATKLEKPRIWQKFKRLILRRRVK